MTDIMSVMSLSKLDIWHAGEKAIQEKVGVSAHMDERQAGRAQLHADATPGFLRPDSLHRPRQRRSRGDAWITFVAGKPGFIHRQQQSLDIDVAGSQAIPPLKVHEGDTIGLLGIELHA